MGDSKTAGYVPVNEGEKRQFEKLRREFGPDVLTALFDETVIEIALNDDGQLWVERLGEAMRPVASMPSSQAIAAIQSVAAYHRMVAHDTNPIVECPLPLDGSRFEGVLPPVVIRPIFSIRRHASKTFSLDDYVKREMLTENQAIAIRDAVSRRSNIIITGGTASGKTTFLNTIMDLQVRSHPDLRCAVIEETQELRRIAENCVMMRSTPHVDLTRLLRTVLRLRPDYINVGEVRGGEAHAMLKLWNTGHPGGAATTHSNRGVVGALLRLEQMVLEAVDRPLQGLIAEAVDVIVSIEKVGVGRRITGVVSVEGFKQGEYIVRDLETGELV
jgi:P-type conjugative transfer ATPase TrbB